MTTYIYAAAIVLGIIAIVALIRLRIQKNTKEKAIQCSIEAKRFHDKLSSLADPSHFFTDEERRQLKKEFGYLLDEVNGLYGSGHISDKYLNELGLRDFIDERRLINYYQFKNNEAHKAQSQELPPSDDSKEPEAETDIQPLNE